VGTASKLSRRSTPLRPSKEVLCPSSGGKSPNVARALFPLASNRRPSWVLSRKARRCFKLASRDALGAGALGFRGALREHRCWFDEVANVLAALPKSAHCAVKTDLAEVWNAEDRRQGADATKALESAYSAKSSKAVDELNDDVECPYETIADDRKGEAARRQTMRVIWWLTSSHFEP
jgi:hypothetical protein